MMGSNRKRPSGPVSHGTGKEPHGNAGPFGPPAPIKQVGRISGPESIHGALMDESYGTASDMTVKSVSVKIRS